MGVKQEYRRLRPTPALADIVESLWIQHQCEAPDIRKPSTVLPTGTVELLFHYGDPIAHLEQDGLINMPRSYVTGQRSYPVQVIGTGKHQAVVVSLYPWGLKTLYPAGVEAVDGYVDLRLMDSSGHVDQLEEQLRLAGNARQRIHLVERFLLATRRRKVDYEMVAASKILSGKSIRQGIQQATRALEMSERHFSRRFKAAVGLTPNLYMRIMRFQHAISVRRELVLPWASIAADCGFSDQPHLVRELKRFSGQVPGKLNLDSGPGNSTFNGKNASEFFDTVYV